MQSPVATTICIIYVHFPSLVPKIPDTALRLLMEQSIEVDDQESAPNDDEPADEDIPTTSSELEHPSESESR